MSWMCYREDGREPARSESRELLKESHSSYRAGALIRVDASFSNVTSCN